MTVAIPKSPLPNETVAIPKSPLPIKESQINNGLYQLLCFPLLNYSIYPTSTITHLGLKSAKFLAKPLSMVLLSQSAEHFYVAISVKYIWSLENDRWLVRLGIGGRRERLKGPYTRFEVKHMSYNLLYKKIIVNDLKTFFFDTLNCPNLGPKSVAM